MKKFLAIFTSFLCFGLFLGSNAFSKSQAKLIPFQLQQKGKPQKVSAKVLNQRVENAILEDTNQQRQKKGLGPLEPQKLLQKAATDHSKDMKQRNYLSHFSPEGKSVVDRLKKYVSSLQTSVGENLHTIRSGDGLYDADAIADLMMSDWMKSKSHRKNILGKQFNYLGVGCASDGREIFCTQVFSGDKLSSR